LILSFKKIHYSHYIILAVHTFFSISSQRYIVFLSLASVTIFSAPLALILNKIITYFQNMRMRWIKSSFILVFYLVCLGILFFVGSGRLFYSDRSISRFGLTFSELAFPQNGVKFVKESGLPMPIFNNYDAGGYLIFKDLKVFIDGRNLVYGEKFFLQYLRIMSEPDILDTFFDIYGIKTVILRHSSQECRIMIQTLANNPLWKLIFLDPVSAVYVKKEYSTPFNEIDINNPQVDILLNALKDFRTKIKYFPNPEINLGNFFLNAGNYKTGAIFFMKAVEKAPETDFLHFNLGAIYLRENKYDNALSEFLAVLKLNKNFKNLYRSIAQTYANLARWDDAIVYYNKAIEKEPDAPALKIDAGRILCKNQKISEGIKYLKAQ
jgi:tetratricopeptide (TPR) repeat protein